MPEASSWRQAGADLILHFIQRLLPGGLLFFKLDEVPAELRLDGLGKLAGVEGERSLVELGNHLPVREPAEFAALRAAARIFGDFLGDLAEVFAGLDALGDFFDLGPSPWPDPRRTPWRRSG